MTTQARLWLFIGLSGLLLLLSRSSEAQLLDAKGLDLFQRSASPDPDIVILAIDTHSLETLGRWPWSRTLHAQLLTKLREYQPELVGIDIAFTTPESDGADTGLADSLASLDTPVVLGAQVIDLQTPAGVEHRLVGPIPRLRTLPNVTVGHANVVPQRDGVARLLPRPIQVNGATVDSFAWALARHRPVTLLDQPQLVTFTGPAATYPTYSIATVLAGDVPDAALTGKVVLIGATASDLHDTVFVPLTRPLMAGVEWQATVLDNLLHERGRLLTPFWLPFGLGVVILGCFMVGTRRWSLVAMTAGFACVPLVVVLISFGAWQAGYALPYVSNSLLGLGLFAGHGLDRWWAAEQEKRRLRATMTPYFAPQIMRLILEQPDRLKLGGELREVSVLFADIRNFTTISEQLPPERLTRLLQAYFTALSEEVFRTDGVLEKYIGDAVMAFWGAPFEQPDHADRAVATARAMIRVVRGLRDQWVAEGYPFVDLGVGIHTGKDTVGNTGSAKRFDYAAIGDTTNSASRIEGLNKEYHTHILISEATKQRLTQPIRTRALGPVLVKGKTIPLLIHEVLVDDEPTGLIRRPA